MNMILFILLDRHRNAGDLLSPRSSYISPSFRRLDAARVSLKYGILRKQQHIAQSGSQVVRGTTAEREVQKGPHNFRRLLPYRHRSVVDHLELAAFHAV